MPARTGTHAQGHGAAGTDAAGTDAAAQDSGTDLTALHGSDAPPSTSTLRTSWFFDAETDLWTFGGSTLIGLLGILLAREWGWLDRPFPAWLWALTVMGVDVAHVHSTWYRTYLQPEEFRRRPWLYTLTPILCLAVSLWIYASSSELFWTLLAYAAVFHFVRQPYGFVMLCRVRGQEPLNWTRWLDAGAIYAATLWPLLWWHGQLPRQFDWFMPRDFVVGLSSQWAEGLFPVYAGLLVLFGLKEAWHVWRERHLHAGKVLILGTTALSWWVGIVAFDSDLSFTLTNVLPHGIPYLVIVWRTLQRQSPGQQGKAVAQVVSAGPALYLGLLVLVAFVEEAVWDKGVWADHPELFGGSWSVASWHQYLIPLLTLPQLTHYVLDGFIWKRAKLPELRTF